MFEVDERVVIGGDCYVPQCTCLRKHQGKIGVIVASGEDVEENKIWLGNDIYKIVLEEEGYPDMEIFAPATSLFLVGDRKTIEDCM